MRALVTGCAGFIGSHLTESLLVDGHDVVGIDALTDTYSRPIKLGNLAQVSDSDRFWFIDADLTEADLAEALEGCDLVFHLAAEPGVRSSWGARFEAYTRNNVLATQRLLEALKPWPDKRMVYASSSSVYGDAERLPTPEDVLPQPFSPYGVTKLAAEHLCLLYHGNYGVDAVALRYFSVYGPRQRPDMAFNRFCQAAVRDEPITVFGDGEQTRDFTYVDDAVAATKAAALAAGASGAVYNIGGGSQVSVNEALDLLSSCVGHPLDVQYVDSELGDVRNTGADTTRAKLELGFSPKIPIEVGLRAEFEWIRSRELRTQPDHVG